MKSESGIVASDGLTVRELLDSTKQFGRPLRAVPIVYMESVVIQPKAGILKFQTETPSSTGVNYAQLFDFYWVDVVQVKDRSHMVEVKTAAGKSWFIKKLLVRENPVAVRCSCPDYRFTFAAYNKMAGAFTGPNFPPYKVKGLRPPRNPQKMPGLCKHLMGVIKKIQADGYIR